MKKIILCIFIINLYLINNSFTQILNIHTNDGNLYQYQISNIDSITFEISSSEPLWIATEDFYLETDNLDSIVIALYGPNYRVADWNDLVSYSQTHDITVWADSIGMVYYGYPYNGFLITNAGYHFWNNTNRHYFIERHNGQVPPGWLVHADINDHFIDLGSWYNIWLRILCFRIN